VTFRESVPYYGEKTDLSFMFKPQLVESEEVIREGENNDVESNSVEKLTSIEGVISGSLPQSRRVEMVNHDSASF
jgi:hypothetical protein